MVEMQVVDLRLQRKQLSPLYTGVAQPMYVCYGTEEVKQFNRLTIITGIESLLKLTSKYKDNSVHQPLDAWIETGERAVPESWTDSEQVVYKLVNGKIVPVDGVFIQLIAFQIMGNWILLATSSGLYKVSIHKWNLSGAVQTQFYRLITAVTPSSRKANMEKHVNRKRTNVYDVRYVHCLLNHSSPGFGNPEKAAQMAYPSAMNKVTKKIIINSPRILQLLIKEIKMLYPDISEELKKLVPVTKVGEHMNAMLDKSIENGTTDDQMKALDVVLKNIYSEPEIVQQELLVANSAPLVGVGEAQPTEILDDKKPKSVKKELTKEEVDQLREDYNVLEKDDTAPLQEIKAVDLE